MSVKQQLGSQRVLDIFGDDGGDNKRDEDANDIAGILGLGGVSTSTIRTTALPSSTLRTFSASSECAPDFPFEGLEDPEKASQNAEPKRPRSV